MGIPSEMMQSIFEPFVTTKGEKGTGLGLWIVHGIINNHGGKISVRSRVGSGRSSKSIYRWCQLWRKGKFGILVVDDEPSVLMTYLLILEKRGFAVILHRLLQKRSEWWNKTRTTCCFAIIRWSKSTRVLRSFRWHASVLLN